MSIAKQIWVEREYRDAWGTMRNSPEDTVALLEGALERSIPDGKAYRCFEPDWMARGQRGWGIAVQLYSLRSSRNWGIGDFTDLQELVRHAAREGADFVGVNPLHALYAAEPRRFSPYSPSSREFINVLYIDPAAMQSFAIAPAAQRSIVGQRFQRVLASLRDAEFVDYLQVAACKEAIFRIVFNAFDALCAREPQHALAIAFDRFVKERGEALQRFAIFQALSCADNFDPNWLSWPAEYRDPTGDAVRRFAETNPEAVRYHAFLQWEADIQLGACAAASREAGMRIGLYLDLAIGTAPESAECWSEQRNIIAGFHIGAPPDDWNELGQDWGLAVYNPYALARSGHAVLRRILGGVMRHAASIRIDHVHGLNRLFLVPMGKKPQEGAYLHLPVEALCDALALESQANRCLIIGEDLGTVPEEVPALLAARNILSCRLLIFAKDRGRFLAPDEYQPNALVSVGTHDLPTLLGYWSGTDLDFRTELGLFPDAALRQRAIEERAADRAAITTVLQAAGFSCDDPAALMAAAHGFLARTPCRLMMVQMEDLAFERNQVNVPASGDNYPNWRHKLGRESAAIFADPRAASVLSAIRKERPGEAGQ